MELLPSLDPKIDLIVERQWHIGIHACALKRLNFLGTVYGGFPSYRYRQLGIEVDNLKTHPFPALWNKVCLKFPFLKLAKVDEAESLAKWVASQNSLANYVICYATAYRFLFPLLKLQKKVLILERGSTYPENFFHQIEKGKAEANLPYQKSLPSEVEQEIEASKEAHFIVAGSQLIKKNYVERGYDPERILFIPYGVNEKLFSYCERAECATRPLRIACVGIIGIRKGINRLLQIGAWAKLRSLNCEIWLIGPLEKEAQQLLVKTEISYRAWGVKKGKALVKILHQSDLYCLPSYEEGFGISVIEAMSTGLPAIVSEETGAKEMIAEDEDGIILKSFQMDELDQKMLPLLKNHSLRKEMGISARQKVENGYTIEHYCKRVESEYGRMFAIVKESHGKLKSAWQSKK